MSTLNNTMYESSLGFFKDNFPVLYAKMKDYKPQAELVFDENGDPDIIFQGTSFYKQSAVTHAKKQLKKYSANPTRVSMAPLSVDSIDKDSSPALKNVFERADKAGITFGKTQTTLTAYHVVSLGFGLGQHIEGLIEITQCRNLILVEPNFEFLYQSLFVFDWRKFGDTCRANMRWFHILTDRNPDKTLNDLRVIYMRYGPPFFDGMTVYEHYTNPLFEPLKHFFENEADMLYSGLGYFDDELNMLGNTYGVLSSGKEYIIDWSRENPGFPVFIIGSGPSLDDASEFILKNQDRAIIVSCGTSLGACLRLGVKPDFHIEMERGQAQVDLPTALQKDGYDLDDIWLIGSTTLLPGIKDIFKKRAFFFRQPLSSYPQFSGLPNQCLRYPSPSVTNSGLSFAQDVGFKEFYFFGLDLGFKDPNCHHSSATSYQWAWTELYDRTFSGNFGGSVLSNHFYGWIRDGLEGAIRDLSYGIKYFNCSDGAKIDHVIPLLAECVSLPEPKKSKQQAVLDITSRFTAYSRKLFESHWDNGALAQKVQALVDDLIRAIEDHPNMFDKKYAQEIMIILDLMEFTKADRMLVQGTVMQAVMALEYYLDRVEDEARHEDFAEIVREELIACIQRLAVVATEEIAILTATGRLGERYDAAVIENDPTYKPTPTVVDE